MSIKAVCRVCNKEQRVSLRKKTNDYTGASITGVPCKSCKRHKLTRV